jgi:plasmid stabilization system protein ParE
VIPVRFHDAARSELAEEVLYYAEIDRRLGERLAQAVERTVALAAEFPEMGSPYKFGTRRVFPKRFPFSVVYLHRRNEIYVLAVAPFRRKPGYWRSRKHEG